MTPPTSPRRDATPASRTPNSGSAPRRAGPGQTSGKGSGRGPGNGSGSGSGGPGSGRRRPRPTGWRRVVRWKWILGGLFTLVVIGLLGFAYAYAVTPIPSANELAKAETSIIYFADGRNEIGRVSEVNREPVDLKDIPVVAQHAMLAAEDRDFYNNSGISPTGIVRAAWTTLTGGQVQGGSTITQQYVKNYFLTQDQTVGRKAKELIISLKIEREQSKDQILENYLNTIYYGRNAYGIKTAARAYFNKDLSALTVSESALLASVIRGPSLYDPSLSAANLQRAKDRVNYVLDGMVSQGWLTSAQRAKATFPTLVKAKTSTARSGPNGYLVDVVTKELVDRGVVSEDEINRGGLRIITTIDKNTQQDAIDAVDSKRPNTGSAANIRVGLASVKPGDGAILALYGGRDYAKTPWNDATQTHIQGGSTFKMFALAAAVEKGISTKTQYAGSSPQQVEGWSQGVRNAGNEQFGMIDLRTATAHSVNTVFAQLNRDVGPDRTMAMAVRMGLPQDNGVDVEESTPGLNALPSNVLGTASARIIDMADAYATIAANGKHAVPYIVRSLSSNDGTITYKVKPEVNDVFSKDVASDVIDCMEKVITEGTASGSASGLGRPAAGKTGTTDENKAVWFDGFVPQMATAVGMYLPGKDGIGSVPLKDLPGFGTIYGGDEPAQIWKAFMNKALDGVPVVDFPARAGIGDSKVPPPAPSTTSLATTASPSPSTSLPSGQPTSQPSGTATPSGSATPSGKPSRGTPAAAASSGAGAAAAPATLAGAGTR